MFSYLLKHQRIIWIPYCNQNSADIILIKLYVVIKVNAWVNFVWMVSLKHIYRVYPEWARDRRGLEKGVTRDGKDDGPGGDAQRVIGDRKKWLQQVAAQWDRGWDLPEAKLEAVMRIQAVVTPSSPEPPTSFSDQVSPILQISLYWHTTL